MLCQVKHMLAISYGDKQFEKVMNAAWHDFNSESYRPSFDKIALITGPIAKNSSHDLHCIYEQAWAAETAEAFRERIDREQFVSRSTQNMLETLRKCLRRANADQEIQDDQLWEICKCFVLVAFDVDYVHSINRVLVQSLIHCKSDKDAKLVWGRLVEYCGSQNFRASTITRDRLPDDILSAFHLPTSESVVAITENFEPDAIWVAIALIGSWDENNAYDVKAIEKVTKRSYCEIQYNCRERLLEFPKVLCWHNGVWKTENRKALIEAVRNRYFDDIIKRAFQVAGEYLQEINGRFAEDGSFSVVSAASGACKNSNFFRKALLEGLCLLKNGSELKNCSEKLFADESWVLISNLFSQMDWRGIKSLSDELSYLAELNPLAYLDCLEGMINTKPHEIERLFPKRQASIFDQNNISSILFTLEMLAWDEQYIVQCIRCLGELEQLEHEETNWTNTPINTIVNILMPFQPQTCASIEKQKHAVQVLEREYEELCWSVIIKLLPDDERIVIADTSRPKYLRMNIPEESSISQTNREYLIQYYIERAILMAGSRSDRLIQLSCRAKYMAEGEQEELLKTIQTASLKWSDEEKNSVWLKLYEQKYKAISQEDGNEPDTEAFALLSQTIDKVCPRNIIFRYQRLYSTQFNEFMLAEDHWEVLDREKQHAIEEIYQLRGIDGVIEFGVSVNAPDDVGRRLGSTLSLNELMATFPDYRTGNNPAFYSGLMKAFLRSHGCAVLREMNLKAEKPEFIAGLFIDAPFTQELMDMILEYLSEKEELFWNSAEIPPYFAGGCEYRVEDVVRKLLQYHRAHVAIRAIGYGIDEIEIEEKLVYKILMQASVDGRPGEIDRYLTCRIIAKLQNVEQPDIHMLSKVECIYLPWLDRRSKVQPKAIYYKLANEPECFCDLIEWAFKKRNEPASTKKLSKAVKERLFQLTFPFRVVPGTDWEGNFHADVFVSWLAEVKDWARKNDCYETAMSMVGNGLSYARVDDKGLVDRVIMRALDEKDEDKLRSGYRTGIVNQRGAYFVDPEGKPELELAQKYEQRADAAEAEGYSRFSETLRGVAEEYRAEAKEHAKQHDSFEE